MARLAILVLSLSASVLAASGVLAQQHVFRIDDSRSSHFGLAVGGAGDVKLDGHDDVIVGAPNGTGFIDVYSGADATLLLHRVGDNWPDLFGRSVTGLGDVDGDGKSDLVVGAPGSNGGDGMVRVLSGHDASVLYHASIMSGGRLEHLGLVVTALGDVDLDGWPDFTAMAERGPGSVRPYGYVRVFSGRDGSLLWQFDAPGAVAFGHDIAGAGDVNRDGHADILVGVLGDSTHGPVHGKAMVFSGVDGSLLYDLFGRNGNSDSFGASVAGVGDVDRDGFDDVLVGAALANGHPGPSYCVLFSGRTGTILQTILEAGALVAGPGDLDGDGVPDLVAVSYDRQYPYLRAISGRHFTWIATVGNTFGVTYWASSLAAAGDCNNDGTPDIVLGSLGYAQPDTVEVFEGRFETLFPDRNTVSVAAGGTVQLAMEAGTFHSGNFNHYHVLASISGTSPGLALGSFGPVHLPLNPDGIMQLTLGPNVFLPNGQGQMDSIGNATASLVLPPQDPGLAGLNFDLAFLVFNRISGLYQHASNPVRITLVP